MQRDQWVSLSAEGEVGPDLLHVGFEGIDHGERFSSTHLKNRPVDDVGREKPFLFPGGFGVGGRATSEQMLHELPTTEGSRVAGWMLGRQVNGFIGGQSRHLAFFKEPVIEPLLPMEIVIFEVEAL